MAARRAIPAAAVKTGGADKVAALAYSLSRQLHRPFIIAAVEAVRSTDACRRLVRAAAEASIPK